MTQRKIYRESGQWVVRELGTSRTLAIVPAGTVFESIKSSESIAREIRCLPEMLSFIRHEAFHGSSEARKLLEQIEG